MASSKLKISISDKINENKVDGKKKIKAESGKQKLKIKNYKKSERGKKEEKYRV